MTITNSGGVPHGPGQETDRFTERLVKRVRTRKMAGEDVCYLDLRHRVFGNQSPRTLRCPTDPGWPKTGRTTSDEETARQWVREHYAIRLKAEMALLSRRRDASTLTVEDAIEDYFRYLEDLYGMENIRSVASKISMLRKNILPELGHFVLWSLSKKIVAPIINGMTVEKVVNGKRVRVPAERGTKINFRRALVALWKHAFEDAACPYAGLVIEDKKAGLARKNRIKSGDVSELFNPKNGALEPSVFLLAATAAAHYDSTTGRRPNMRVTMISNTVHAMMIATALGLRIDEVLSLRWKHFDFDRRVVSIPGTKSEAALRVVPLQEQLYPWLVDLARMDQVDTRSSAYVVRTQPRKRATERGSPQSVAGRITSALRSAGLKQSKKATHWMRATHISWARRVGSLPNEALKFYVGHSDSFGDLTTEYTAQLIESMPDEHRRYIQHLPSPEAVRDALLSFQPVNQPPRPAKKESRTKEALEAQHARGRAKKPLHFKLRPE